MQYVWCLVFSVWGASCRFFPNTKHKTPNTKHFFLAQMAAWASLPLDPPYDSIRPLCETLLGARGCILMREQKPLPKLPFLRQESCDVA